MKAYSLHAIGELKYEEVRFPPCPSGWCIVRVKASGICSSDIPRIFVKGAYHFPLIPGHEFSGIVEKVADTENKYLIGRKVGVFPLIPCRKCLQCLIGNYELCANYDYLGSRRNGGFAEYAAVPVWNLVELDEQVSFTDAAMMEPLAVSLHAVKQLSLCKTDHVAIVGTGMIAFAAAQWARCQGVSSVTVFGRTEGKRRIAESIRDVRYATFEEGHEQFDAVLEAVGNNDAIAQSLSLAKAGGRLVLMGNPTGTISLGQDAYWGILRKQLTLKGTWNSSYEKGAESDWTEVQKGLADGSIETQNLISHVFPQERLGDALRIMSEHKEPYCKVMTVWNDGEK